MIVENKVVSIHYQLTDDNGVELDSSKESEPLNYLAGAGNIIPGLDNALVGKAVGDKLDVVVEPAEAYGEHNPEMIQRVPKTAFQGVDNIEVGMQFRAQAEGGELSVTVTEVSDEEVVVDANHPLAGKRLTFAVEVVEVRDASPEEIEHGHVH